MYSLIGITLTMRASMGAAVGAVESARGFDIDRFVIWSLLGGEGDTEIHAYGSIGLFPSFTVHPDMVSRIAVVAARILSDLLVSLNQL